MMRLPLNKLLLTLLLMACSGPSNPSSNMTKPEHDDAYWQANLTAEQYRILRQAGTEAPFSGEYDKHFAAGGYLCVGCDNLLFRSEEKFDAGCGWPAFSLPWNPKAVTEHQDNSLERERIEIRCAECAGHLGHVFTDGPPPTGLRYCINSGAMKYVAEVDLSTQDNWAVATFAGG